MNQRPSYCSWQRRCSVQYLGKLMNFPFTQGDASELLKSLGLSDSFIKCYFSLGLPCILSEQVKVTHSVVSDSL